MTPGTSQRIRDQPGKNSMFDSASVYNQLDLKLKLDCELNLFECIRTFKIRTLCRCASHLYSSGVCRSAVSNNKQRWRLAADNLDRDVNRHAGYKTKYV